MGFSVFTELCIHHHNQFQNRHMLDFIWEKPLALELRLWWFAQATGGGHVGSGDKLFTSYLVTWSPRTHN